MDCYSKGILCCEFFKRNSNSPPVLCHILFMALKTWLFCKIILEHSVCHQCVTKIHSWWVETLYITQTMLQSKRISYKIASNMLCTLTQYVVSGKESFLQWWGELMLCQSIKRFSDCVIPLLQTMPRCSIGNSANAHCSLRPVYNVVLF